MRVLVSGASGLVGKNFIRHMLRQGHEVFALVRSPESFKLLPEKHIFRWNHRELIDESVFENMDALVHLAGENIAEKPWSEEQKKRIVESRLVGTQSLIASLEKLSSDKRPKVLFSASAIGFYGYSREEIQEEESTAGNDFLADLCANWEREALKAEQLGVRVVLARTGIVLSKEGGALVKMPPVQISAGTNWMSWIHVEDMIRIIEFSLSNGSLKGAINCVAPYPVQSKEFIKELAQVQGVPIVAKVPRLFLDLALGEVAKVILSSLNVRPKKLLEAGFSFHYPKLHLALQKELAQLQPLDACLIKDQFVPLKPEEVFPFFSRAENLEALTPPWLNFKITSKTTEEINKGSLINYKLKIHGVPVRWKTLISEWKENEFFIDEQLKGPYSKWHHVHSFVPVPGGCLLRDEITYRVPGLIFGKLFLGKWISSDVNAIFSYRQKRIQEFLESGLLK